MRREQRVAARFQDRTARMSGIASDDVITDRRDEIEELEAQYERNLNDPRIFQTKVPTLYDIGKPNGTGVTPFCNKCSKDTFYCTHRVGKGAVTCHRVGPSHAVSREIGSGDVLSVTKPQYGLKGNLNTFYDRSHLGSL
jgi:hypothetical protein